MNFQFGSQNKKHKINMQYLTPKLTKLKIRYYIKSIRLCVHDIWLSLSLSLILKICGDLARCYICFTSLFSSMSPVQDSVPDSAVCYEKWMVSSLKTDT